jgi:lipopolysaccharide/colanic/teichoic acid biosynthesis glycosyltransferase
MNIELLREFDSQALNYSIHERKFYYFIKRLVDIVIAATLLVLLSPVMLVVAILIKLDSPGPVIFIQERVGAKMCYHDGKLYWQREVFPCYKFRTMVASADPALHKSFVKHFIKNDKENMATYQESGDTTRKLVKDPRVTRIGSFLRKSSLDEVPQLWNVLRNEMSMVGPRPPIPYEVDLYKEWHYQRLLAKPGLTGWWQVTARSSVDFDEMVELDIEYIENQSIWLDLKIILMTPFAVISLKGAT